MQKMKINQIKISASNDVRTISGNISKIVEFVASTATEINRAITEFNKVLPNITEPFDDSELKKQVARIIKTIDSIDVKYDDSKIKNQIAALKEQFKLYATTSDVNKLAKRSANTVTETYDDSDLRTQLTDAIADNLIMKDAISELKKTISLNQAEIRSYRNIAGSQLDEMRRKIDKLTEVK